MAQKPQKPKVVQRDQLTDAQRRLADALLQQRRPLETALSNGARQRTGDQRQTSIRLGASARATRQP